MGFKLAFSSIVDDNTNTEIKIAYIVKNAGTLYANGTYNYAGEYNEKPYYTYDHSSGILPDGSKHYTTMYLSYRSGTSGWGITESQLSGTITPLYYQSVISETPDLGTFACATGASPAPIIEQTIVEINDDTNNEPEEDKGIILTVSGCIDEQESNYVNQSSQMNGNYYLIDKAATYSKRIWKHELYEYYIVCFEAMGWWVITNSPDSTRFSIKTDTSENPYSSNGSSKSWYSGNTIASNIKITATNF